MRCHWGRCCVLVVVYLTDALREKRASTAQHCTAQHRNLGLHTFILIFYLMAACGGMYGGVEGEWTKSKEYLLCLPEHMGVKYICIYICVCVCVCVQLYR